MSNDAVGKMRARVAAWRHRNPGRGLKVIAIAGGHGKTTTALLLSEILQETHKSVITLTTHGCFHNGQRIADRYDSSAEQFQRLLSAARKKNVDYVVVEVNDLLVATQVLPTVQLEMSVITDDAPCAKALFDQPVEYTVVPHGFDVANLRVAPHQAISFGEDEASEAQIARVTELRRGTEIDIIIDHQTKLTAATYLVGKANALNVAAAVSAAYVLAADTNTFEEGVARLERVTGNFEYLPKTSDAFDVAVDAAHDEVSVRHIATSANGFKKRRLLIAADASVPAAVHAEVKRLSDRLVVVGEASDVAGVDVAADIQMAFDLMKRAAKKDDLILLLGSEYAAIESEGTTRAHRMAEAKSE